MHGMIQSIVQGIGSYQLSDQWVQWEENYDNIPTKWIIVTF